jgi:hypothetical protein
MMSHYKLEKSGLISDLARRLMVVDARPGHEPVEE